MSDIDDYALGIPSARQWIDAASALQISSWRQAKVYFISLLAGTILVSLHPALKAADIQVDGSTKTRLYNIDINNAQFSADGTRVNNVSEQSSTSASQVVITTGTKAGSNAFNSFNTFNVPSGKNVHLILPVGTNTLINRVTGKTSSTIAGYLESNMFDTSGNRITGGHVVLLNPNGIAFTGTAQVNVGALTATSATGIRFSDGIMGAKISQDLDSAPFTGTLQRYIFNLENNQRAAAIRALDGSRITAETDITLTGGNVWAYGNLSAGGQINLISADYLNGEGQRTAFEIDINSMASRFNARHLSARVNNAASVKALHQQLNSDFINQDLIVAGNLPDATQITLSGNQVLLAADSKVIAKGTVNTDTLVFSNTGDAMVFKLQANLNGAHATSVQSPDGYMGKNLTVYSVSGGAKSFHSTLSTTGGNSLASDNSATGGDGGTILFAGKTVTMQNTTIQGHGGKTLGSGIGGAGGSLLISATEEVNIQSKGANNWVLYGGLGQHSSGVGGRIFIQGQNILGDGPRNFMHVLGSGSLATGDKASFQQIDLLAADTIRLGQVSDTQLTFQLRARGTNYPFANPPLVQKLDDGNDVKLAAQNIQLHQVIIDTNGADAPVGSQQAGGTGGTIRITADNTLIHNSQVFSSGGITRNLEKRGHAHDENNGHAIEIIGRDTLTVRTSGIISNGGRTVSGTGKGGSIHLTGNHIALDGAFIETRGGEGIATGNTPGHGGDGGIITIDGYQTLTSEASTLRATGWMGAHGAVLEDGRVFAGGRGGNGGTIIIAPDASLEGTTTHFIGSDILAWGGRGGSVKVTDTDNPATAMADGGNGGKGGAILIGHHTTDPTQLKGDVIFQGSTDRATIVDASGGNGGKGGSLYKADTGFTRAGNGGHGGAGGSVNIHGNHIALNAYSEIYASGGHGDRGGDLNLTQRVRSNHTFRAGTGGTGGQGGSVIMRGNQQILLSAELAQIPLTAEELNALLDNAQSGKASLTASLGEAFHGALIAANGGRGGNAGNMLQAEIQNKHQAVIQGASGGQGGSGGEVLLSAENQIGMQGVIVEENGTLAGSIATIQTLGGQGGDGSALSNNVKKFWLTKTGNGGQGGQAGSIRLSTNHGPMQLEGWVISEGGNGGQGGGLLEDGTSNNGDHTGTLEIGRGGNGGAGGTIRVATQTGTILLGAQELASSQGPDTLSAPKAYSLITANGGQGGKGGEFPRKKGSPKDTLVGPPGFGGPGGNIYIINHSKPLAESFALSDNQIITARGGHGGNADTLILTGATLAQVTQLLQGSSNTTSLPGTQNLLLGGDIAVFSLIESINGPYTEASDATVQSALSVYGGQGDEYGGQGGIIQFEAAE